MFQGTAQSQIRAAIVIDGFNLHDSPLLDTLLFFYKNVEKFG